jgi:hypothetical protein
VAVAGGCRMIFVLTLLVVLFFFAVAALVLFFLFDIFLPILGQQGIPVADPLVTPTPDTISDFFDLGTESGADFLPLLHTSPNDCKVLEALHDHPEMRKQLCSAFRSCVRTCPRTQINFDTLTVNEGAECRYVKENTQTIPAKLATVWFTLKKRKG